MLMVYDQSYTHMTLSMQIQRPVLHTLCPEKYLHFLLYLYLYLDLQDTKIVANVGKEL